MMLNEHKNMISKLENQADNTSNNLQMQSFASQSLPVLRQQLLRAEQLERRLQQQGGGQGGSQSSGQGGASGESGSRSGSRSSGGRQH